MVRRRPSPGRFPMAPTSLFQGPTCRALPAPNSAIGWQSGFQRLDLGFQPAHSFAYANIKNNYWGQGRLMKNFAVSVSLAALAVAGCSTTPPAQLASTAPTEAAAPAASTEYPLTPEGARAFIAAVEKDLFDLSVIGGRAAWVNSTYINDDTDALAAYFGTIATEKGVKYASEAAKYAKVQGLDFDTARKLNILRGGLVLPAPQTPGAAAELNTIATRLQSTYGKGRALHRGKEITGDDAEALMGTLRNPAEL